jgi:uncharacterized protein
MIALIEQHRPEVATQCRRFGVQSLEVFGSAASGAFDPARSDIDFLVEFDQDDAGSLFHRYFGLQEALEQLFDRKTDLVTASALKTRISLRRLTCPANQSMHPRAPKLLEGIGSAD